MTTISAPVAADQTGRPALHADRSELAHRGQAKADPARQAARMLEGLFVRQLMKALGKDASQSSLFGKSLGRNIYQEMFQGAIADQIQAAGGMGLATQLEAQLRANTSPQTRRGAHSGASPRALATALSSALSSAPTPPPVDPIASAAPTVRQQPVAARPPHPVAQAVAQTRGRQALTQAKTSGRTLHGVSYAAPTRPAQSLPRDADGKLVSPLAGARAGERLQGSVGQRVSAAASGRVLSTSVDGLVLQHAGGRTTRYEGLGRVDAQPGDLVLRGQALGTLGPQKILRFSVQERGATLDVSKMKRLFLSR